ncbi:conserved hypothetical protein [Bathymodiolus platifrons methanotrophic gill symbiont]|uniref:porin n=1 Tax=Bathymodiolus platifrons methanotrophic gill symbiont TaxID=113268 RepID=UPI000B40E768|nr:porin [Bathymodiolus platifrons methanotrophic gill symbiont]TXL08406.1 hypothetical protein BMR07_02160 [Methylococcaceae bacterium CS1]TXL15596.1 hypothetical protein BMR05_02850 [Methylococcaceae bacterium HT4]TXL21055.1 hypothetical protein BMR06_02495 [Methylococcaceae bacterium HT5]GAW84785.1 conserved hypothetical protein [Bathymodiolus platifrons methanotrophic gill symbiont]GFO77588.1 hypothetical protein BPLS_P6122 [Bathymodiolus platifrons methanotrophic gill symbiont]
MNKKQSFTRTLLSTAILLASSQVSANDAADHFLTSDTLFTNFINDTSFMQDTGFEVGMWASAGITGNTNGGSNNPPGNAPVLFNDRVNEVLFNQLNFYVERAVTKGDKWDVGMRMDFMYGSDARFTQASGWDDDWVDGHYYNIAMPQLYMEVYAPLGNGVTAKLGHFYTTIGYEVVPSPDNFFYSHAYTMLYAEPFTHTGVMLSYDIDDNWSINGGAVEGWDNMTENAGAWSFLGGASWTSNDQSSSVTVQLISGNISDTGSSNRTMYSIVATHDFSDKFHYVFQHDFGTQNRDDSVGQGDGNWFGINQYFTYDINDQLGLGLRAEWFNDKGGAQRVNAVGANYLAASFGVNYTPLPWLKFRPELRLDWADEKVFNGNKGNDQVEFAMDMIITF